jgi:hypothetical protein
MRRPARLERAGALTPRDRIGRRSALAGPCFLGREIMLLGRRDDTVPPTCAAGKGRFVEALIGCLRTKRRSSAGTVGTTSRMRRVTGEGKPVEQEQARADVARRQGAPAASTTALAAAASTEKHRVSPERPPTVPLPQARQLLRGHIPGHPGPEGPGLAVVAHPLAQHRAARIVTREVRDGCEQQGDRLRPAPTTPAQRAPLGRGGKRHSHDRDGKPRSNDVLVSWG